MPNDIVSAERLSQTVSVLPPLVSVIVSCCGMHEYTKLLVPSLLKYTPPPFELIFLDVGSLDGTAEYLSGLSAGLQNVRVETVRAATDLDISAATKEALAKVRGEFVVLLNNDTVVTQGWVQQMQALLAMSPTVGMVGPMSCYSAPPQLVESIPYRIAAKRPAGSETRGNGELVDVGAIDRFAVEFREANKGKWLQSERLGGFCVMLKREVLRRVTNQGQLDKWTDLGLFDSDIFGTKAREAGYSLAVCRDLYIHHFGTRTFAHGATPADPKGNERP